LILNVRDINSKLNLSDENEFALTLNEPISEGELDKSKMSHLAEYFKLEYNDALVYIYIYIYNFIIKKKKKKKKKKRKSNKVIEEFKI